MENEWEVIHKPSSQNQNTKDISYLVWKYQCLVKLRNWRDFTYQYHEKQQAESRSTYSPTQDLLTTNSLNTPMIPKDKHQHHHQQHHHQERHQGPTAMIQKIPIMISRYCCRCHYTKRQTDTDYVSI